MESMAEKAEKKSVFVGGGNGQPATAAHTSEVDRAKDVARRYRCEYVDLHDFQLHHDLFTKIPPRLMFSYNFVPLEETHDGRLAIAIADPSQLMMIDEISYCWVSGSSPKWQRWRRSAKFSRKRNSRSGCSKMRAKDSRWTSFMKKKA